MNQTIQPCYALPSIKTLDGVPDHEPPGDLDTTPILIASFHNGNIDERVLAAQQRVFHAFGLHINQWRSDRPHGEAMDEFIAASRGLPWAVACLFDVDAIPTDRNKFLALVNDMAQGLCGLIGGAHNANHHREEDGRLCRDYVSPACQIVTRQVIEEALQDGIGYAIKPCLEGQRGFYDAGEHFSEWAQERFDVELLYPVSVAEERWWLEREAVRGKAVKFGLGTEYSHFYHQFEIRTGNNVEAFVERCERAIRENA